VAFGQVVDDFVCQGEELDRALMDSELLKTEHVMVSARIAQSLRAHVNVQGGVDVQVQVQINVNVK
jgi:hypothetical protein